MYRPISDYGLIGDTQTAALIAADGSLDFLCLPRFDCPALFLRLLDDRIGGACSLRPRGLRSHSRRYLPNTNILETTFVCDGGTLTLTDFMPVRRERNRNAAGQEAASSHRIVRLLRCMEGEIACDIEVHPTFDYARHAGCPSVVRRGIGETECALFSGPDGALHVQAPAALIRSGDALTCRAQLRQGEEAGLILTWAGTPHEIEPLTPEDIGRHLDETTDFWQRWCESCNFQGEYHGEVLRSALTLKLLVYEPTGAIIAAPTTSLPESIGGARNWDYRYTWLRDSSLTLVALMNLGYFGEAHDYLHFLHRALPDSAADFQVMYRVDGGADIAEEVLDHLEGYRQSRPVRVGNGAVHQRQLDIYGELLHCTFLYWAHDGFEHHGESFRRDFWPFVHHVTSYVAEHWREPGADIWESRGPRREYTHSKGMCWVALDRAIRLARARLPAEDVSHWQHERDEILRDLEQHGFNPALGAYTQSYGSTALDSSILRLPLLHVRDARSSRMRSTIAAIERQLMENRFLYRYRPAESDDGLRGSEGAFTACAFWLVENYAMQGRMHEADDLFRHLASHANDLGLLSEEIDPVSGEALGNFPQGFSHIALINAAVRLAAAHRGDVPETEKLMHLDSTRSS